MCGFGDQFSRRLLAHYIFRACAIGNLVRRVGLAKSELRFQSDHFRASRMACWGGDYLFKFNGRFDFGDMLGDVSLERRDVNGLSHSSGHFEFCKAVGKRIREEEEETW